MRGESPTENEREGIEALKHRGVLLGVQGFGEGRRAVICAMARSQEMVGIRSEGGKGRRGNQRGRKREDSAREHHIFRPI